MSFHNNRTKVPPLVQTSSRCRSDACLLWLSTTKFIFEGLGSQAREAGKWFALLGRDAINLRTVDLSMHFMHNTFYDHVRLLVSINLEDDDASATQHR